MIFLKNLLILQQQQTKLIIEFLNNINNNRINTSGNNSTINNKDTNNQNITEQQN